jgi:tetratricopeptide (TPR) repeat protein
MSERAAKHGAGARRLAADLSALEQEAQHGPHRAESLERLGELYAAAGHHELAMGAWQRRLDACSTTRERFVASLALARAAERALERWPDVMERLLQAHLLIPEHPAPLVRLSLSAAARDEDPVAWLFAARARELDAACEPRGVLTREEHEAFTALVERLQPRAR